MKVSQVFYPNTAKRSSKTGKTPLYLRICLNGQKAETRLNEEITDKELQLWNVMTMRFDDRKFSANRTLNSIDQKFNDFIFQNSTVLSKFTAKQVRDYIMGRYHSPVSASEYIAGYFNSAIATNAELAKGTVKAYNKAINHMKKFMNLRKIESILITDITTKLAFEFKDYLTNNNAEQKRKGMTETSAAGIIKKFKTIFDRAVNEGLIEKNPFKVLKLSTSSPMRERLTPFQVNQLWSLDLTKFPAQRVYRDIFLFSVFTGLAYKDAVSLSYSHLDQRPDGNIKLCLSRIKTDERTEMFLVSHAKDIVKKYKNSTENEITNFILPPRSNKSLNLQLKMLAELANIPVKLTSHIARHTFRQFLSEAGIEDYGVIKRMMGHSRRNDIDGVYYAVTETRLIEAKRKFELFLQNVFSESNPARDLSSN